MARERLNVQFTNLFGMLKSTLVNISTLDFVCL